MSYGLVHRTTHSSFIINSIKNVNTMKTRLLTLMLSLVAGVMACLAANAQPVGDVTGDGTVDVSDVNAAINMILNVKTAADYPGNVWEWCNDWYRSNYYQNSPAVNPPGPDSGMECRVLRGGCCGIGYNMCRVAYRNYGDIRNKRHAYKGMRLAL